MGALGNRPVLPSSALADADLPRQQQAQRACVQLAQQLLHAGGSEGVQLQAEALLLDCTTEPLAASLALKQAADALTASAASAGSPASRQAAAQRAAAAALFRGDVGSAVQLLLQHDALTADFVSMSAAAGGRGMSGVSGRLAVLGV